MRGFWRALDRLRPGWARKSPARPRVALALAGGGVIGGMYEVGAAAALEARFPALADGFDVYVGCSAGAVVGSLLANGIRAGDLFDILDEDRPDSLNFRRSAVYASDSLRRAFTRFGRLLWTVGKGAIAGGRNGSLPDILAQAEGTLPPGLFSLASLERFLDEAFADRGLPTRFAAVPRTLLIPAIDLDRGERVVFGRGDLAEVPVPRAIVASSAIPGFFEPYRVEGRDYIDGGVGFCGHADLAAEAGADLVIVVNPLVPTRVQNGEGPLRDRGIYLVMEQAGRVESQSLLQLALADVRARFPRTAFVLLQPERDNTPLFGHTMGFEASRRALRFGRASIEAWLDGVGGAALARHLAAAPTLA